MFGVIVGILVLVAVVAVALLQLSMAKAKAMAGDGVEPRQILSDNELEFFHRLQRALPQFHIFPQVAANALLKVGTNVPKQRYHAIRNRFAQKHVDFVVCERESLDVKAVIELDDRTHKPDKDKARDTLFNMAGYTVHRFQSRQKPSEAELAALLSPPPIRSMATLPDSEIDRF